MKNPYSVIRLIVCVLALSMSLLAQVGCGADAGVDKKDESKRLEYAKSLRSFFDKAHGDYSQLSETDKAEYVRIAGGQEKASQLWELMKNGPSRPAGTAAP